MASHKIKLIYFDSPGLAETSRLLLKIGGLPFEDFRYPIAFVDGKPVRPEFDAAKAAGTFPFGQIPVLEVDGVKIGQSKAIERYIAKETGLLGASTLEAAQIEALAEQLVDLRNAFVKANYLPDEEAKKTAKAAFYDNDLPKNFDILEHVAGSSGHLFGNALSLVDVQFFTAVNNLLSDNAEHTNKQLASHPKLHKVFQTVGALPAVVAHKKPKYKLTYFDGRGYAETTRYLFKIGGIDFEDFRFPLAIVDGKPVRPEFEEAKAAGTFPFGQIPVLEVNGEKIAQSRAIERFVAKQIGLAGSNDVEGAKIDAYGEQILDLRNAFSKAHHTQGDEAKAAAEAAFYGNLNNYLDLIENQAGNDGYLVGKKLSLADVQLFAGLEALELNNPAATKEALSKHPKLQHIVQTVGAIPALAKYRAERKPTII